MNRLLIRSGEWKQGSSQDRLGYLGTQTQGEENWLLLGGIWGKYEGKGGKADQSKGVQWGLSKVDQSKGVQVEVWCENPSVMAKRQLKRQVWRGKVRARTEMWDSQCTGMDDGVVWDVTDLGQVERLLFWEAYFEVKK